MSEELGVHKVQVQIGSCNENTQRQEISAQKRIRRARLGAVPVYRHHGGKLLCFEPKLLLVGLSNYLATYLKGPAKLLLLGYSQWLDPSVAGNSISRSDRRLR